MNYPKKVYALFPYDEKGDIAGVYIGVSGNLKDRLRVHLNTPSGKGNQDRLHELMRRNGYTFTVLDEVETWKDGHLEYDWLDFYIKKTDFQVFNNVTGLCQANWERVFPREKV